MLKSSPLPVLLDRSARAAIQQVTAAVDSCFPDSSDHLIGRALMYHDEQFMLSTRARFRNVWTAK